MTFNQNLNYTIGSGDFTIEFFQKFTDTPSASGALIDMGGDCNVLGDICLLWETSQLRVRPNAMPPTGDLLTQIL